MKMYHSRHTISSHVKQSPADVRLRVVAIAVTLFALLIGGRLFILMILQHDFYMAVAAGSQETFARLIPKRGEVFIQDSRTKEEYPLAINRDFFLIYADTREIKDDATAEMVAQKLAEVFHYDEERKLAVFLQLNKRSDPYEPIEQKVDEAIIEQLRTLELTGIAFVRRPQRFYPEGLLAAQVIGFLGKDEEGNEVGRYGIEGYWQKELAGSGGFFAGARSATGGWIPLAGRTFKPAADGVNLLLTIDRTIQFEACERLRQGMAEFKATSAALIIMDPNTGAIRAMCSLPDFDPNIYNQVDSIDIYNNAAIFTPYEPGSIFKPIAMAGALNEGVVKPETIFQDTGSRDGLCQKPIKNAGAKIHGSQTMTGILQQSINTGMVFVGELLGKQKLREYVERFGFGVREGLELDSEVSGTIESLSKNRDDRLDCYGATASFGQGIAVTPLQMAVAFSVMANGGKLMKPMIVEEIRYADGLVEKKKPVEIRRVLEERTASILSAMLVKVVDEGYSGRARAEGYYVAGKSGTAQVPGPGGYTSETNQSFVGFAPVDDPKFVMIVKYEKPQRTFAEYTAAPVFGEITRFLLQYYKVAPN